MQKIVTKSELARVAGINPTTATRLCKKTLAPALVGKKIDINHPLVKKYLKDRDERLKVQTQELLRTKEKLEKTNADLLNQSKELRRSLKELSVLFEASKKVGSSLSLSEIMDAIMDLLMDKFKTDTWSIRLLDEDGYLRIKRCRPDRNARMSFWSASRFYR